MRSHQPKSPTVLLREDHRRIDELLNRLIATLRADDRDAAAKAWSHVEKTVLIHLDVEEMFVFPALAKNHEAEVQRLRREHDAFRCQLGEIGVALELHTARCAAVESFCAALREHARQEEALVYVEAERLLSRGIARAIEARIESVISTLGGQTPQAGAAAISD